MKDLVREYARKVNMEHFLNKEPSEISGGQKQRVAIAGILALGLKIVIFDEATSMLDPEGVEDIKRLINEMRSTDKDLTFISITHDIEEAYMSDRVIIMNKHRIFKDGTPNEVFKNVDEIRSIGLDAPFILRVKDALKKKGIKVDDKAVTLDSLARDICKSK
jgi:energy-coupling factor transport system ATP-binding protein